MKPKYFLKDSNPELLDQFDSAANTGTLFEEIGRGSDKKFFWKCSKGHSWEATASSRAAGRGCPYCAGKQKEPGKNSLAEIHPALFRELHPTLNKGLNFATISPSSHFVAFWICPANEEHVYDMPIHKRADRKQGCPFCANKRVLVGDNDLESNFPDIAASWHPEKNGELTPRDVVQGSQKIVWWLCSKNHEFQTRIAHRTGRGIGCPYCAGRYAIEGETDLQTTNPEILDFWDYEKNGALKPKDISSGSDVEVWWRCKDGHSIKKGVYEFVRAGKGCAVCNGKTVLIGFNDVMSDEILRIEIDQVKNRELGIQLDGIHRGSHTKIWWKCTKGHSWNATPEKRLSGRGCPRCSAGGFDATSDGYIYFLSNAKFRAKKVGITNQLSNRLDSFKQLGWVVIWKSDLMPGTKCREAELKFFNWLRNEMGFPAFLGSKEMGRVSGFSETFSGDLDDEMIIKRLAEFLMELD